jgi:PBSX family phage terminase large subunit
VSNSTAKLNIIQSDGFGVANYFAGRCREGQYQDRPALYINTKVGEKVILIGGGANVGSEKFIKGFTLGTIYVSEANECSKTFIKECFDRTLSSHLRKMFFDINPKDPRHYFYEEILDVHEANNLKYKDYGYTWSHFTIADNNSISDEDLRIRLRGYNRESVWYRRDILGLRSAAEGLIYDMWSEEENSYDDESRPVNLERVSRRYIPIDYGTQNPMAFIDVYDDGVTLWFDKEYYYSGRTENAQKTDAQYGDDLEEFIGNNDIGQLRTTSGIIIDPSAASFKAECNQRHIRTRDADNSKLDGIRMMSNMIQKRLIRVHKRCVNFRLEIASYVWDDKQGKNGEDVPLDDNNHLMDCSRYLVKTIITPRRIASS